MNQIDQNINKDMIDFDLVDVQSLDFSDDQTWLYTVPNDSGNKVDIVDWNLSCDWPVSEDDDYQQMEKQLNDLLDNILKNNFHSQTDKHKFDSRTYVRPKKRIQRPSIQNIVEVVSNPPSLTQPINSICELNTTMTHPLNSMSGLNTTMTLPLNSISGLNTTMTHPINSMGGLNTTMTHPINSMGGLNTTMTHPINSMSGLNTTMTHPINSMSGLNTTMTHPYNSMSRLNTTTSGPNSMSGLNTTMNVPTPATSAFNPALSALSSVSTSANKYLTYNKYNAPLGPISPMLRLKTFNVDTNTENSIAVKEYALKRRSLVQDDDPQLEDMDMNLAAEASGRLSMEHTPSKPINIDLSQPAHNLHNTFNKGLTNMMNERGSLNMYQSGESLMRMSPPSLVSSLMMESSGTFNPDSMDGRKSMPSYKDSGLPTSGRDSIDPMMTSMTLSILDEKDMSTSFLSQTTYPDNDSLMDSLPPSLVSSVNSSYVVSNTSKPKENNDSNIFSSATFTHLEQSEKLLSARPRCHLFNSFTKRESGIRNSESYTKSREEACQIDTVKVLNENSDKKESPKPKPNVDMAETITLHYANNKFRDAEKENFERDDAFYKDMGVPKPEDVGRNSLNNMTLGKQELNEIIQARQKLSLARKALPTEPDKNLPNQVDPTAVKTIQLPNQTITVPKQSMENVSELLSRRRALNNGYDKPDDQPTRETPKRSATFKKVSPKASTMDTTVVYVKADEKPASGNIIDINSATLTLVGDGERTLQQEDWGSQERAMVASSESTDTGTFSSSSPPDSVPDTAPHHDHRQHNIASTPLMSIRKGVKNDLLNLHNTISPIYDMVDDKSYTLTKAPSNASAMERTYDMHNTTVINSATMVKKSSVKRDILAGRTSPEKRVPNVMKSPGAVVPPMTTASYGSMVPPSGVPRKSSLPTSKLRQYSSHRELNRIPAGPPAALRGAPAGRAMVRRGVYASNPALSPTAPAPSLGYPAELHREEEKPSRPTLANPPALVRQGTETLRRERPQSQLVAPRDLRGAGSGVPVSMRNHQLPPPTTRPYSIAGASQLRVSRPASGPVQKPAPVAVTEQPRPASSNEPRLSALPRPTRLPAPRRALRPPSVYSVAPTADADHY